MSITDPEFTNASARIELKYAEWEQLPPPAGPRVPRTVFTDQLSGRWMVDYYTLRASGRDHEAAIREVERRMHAVVGLSDPWPPPPLPTPGSALQGLLRLSSGAYVDDTGPVLPVFDHLGDGYSRFLRARDGVLALLDDIARAGYHGIRFWTVLRGSYWAGRECDAGQTPDQFAAFGQELVARGLQAVVSQGDMWQPGVSDAARQRVKEAIRSAFPRAAVAFCDAGNEVNNNGGARPEQCADWIAGLPGILSLSTTQSEEPVDLAAWSRSPAMIFDEHGYRGGRWWDKIRHMRNLVSEGAPEDRRLGIQSEPFGVGRRVSVTQNMGELTDDVMAFAGAVSLTNRQAYVRFSGPGIISDEAERLQDMPGFRSVPALAALLPRDVMAFSRLVHGGSSQGSARVFAVTDEPGTTRCDHAIASDGRFVCTIYGPNPQYRQQRDYESVEDRTLQNGQLRLVVGRLK